MGKPVTDQESIDFVLTYLTNAWEDVEEISTFDENSRFDYAIDWPLKTMAEGRLHALIAQHGLTPAQQQRYDALRALQAKNKHLLDQILAG